MGAIEIQMSSTLQLMAIASGEYDASEFCQGLQFGIHGSNLLISVAKSLVQEGEQMDALGYAQQLGVQITMPE